MSDPKDPRQWVEIAEGDYRMAVSALRYKKPNIIAACFHAQQCAEKFLKAMLVAKKKPFPKTHDLIALSDLCEQAGILMGMDKKRLNDLSDHAVRVRYPGTEPSVEETREALQTAQVVRKFARTFLNVK